MATRHEAPESPRARRRRGTGCPASSTSFSIGVRSFDPEKVGYLTDVPGFPKFSAKDAQGKWIPGNRNDGHDFGSKPTVDERHQLLEYLKTL